VQKLPSVGNQLVLGAFQRFRQGGGGALKLGKKRENRKKETWEITSDNRDKGGGRDDPNEGARFGKE